MPPSTLRTRFAPLLSLVIYTVAALLIVTPIRLFVAEPFIVSGDSMDPLIKNREYVVIDHLSTYVSKLERGDVVTFQYPLDPDIYLIKRVIGLPGETVRIDNGIVSIENDTGTFVLPEPYAVWKTPRAGNDRMTLEEDEYYVLGDNRTASADSRVWGPLQKRFIVGRPVVRLFPFERATFSQVRCEA